MEELYEDCDIESVQQKELANKLMNFLSVHKFFKEHKDAILLEKLRSLFQGFVFLDLLNENSSKVFFYFALKPFFFKVEQTKNSFRKLCWLFQRKIAFKRRRTRLCDSWNQIQISIAKFQSNLPMQIQPHWVRRKEGIFSDVQIGFLPNRHYNWSS